MNDHKANMPTSGSGPFGMSLLLQVKTVLINAWRSEGGRPHRRLNAVIRIAEGGKTLVSFGQPFARLPRPGEPAVAPELNAKRRRAINAELRESGAELRERGSALITHRSTPAKALD